MRRTGATATLALLALGLAAAPAAASSQLTEQQAAGDAARVPAVQRALTGAGRPGAVVARSGEGWTVTFFARGSARAQVELDARGRPQHVFTGLEARFPLARGGRSGVGLRKVAALWAWLPLTAVFVLAFFDWRRPLRLLHLDFAVVASLGISFAFFKATKLHASVPLAYPPLVYLAARTAWAGLRPRERAGPLTRLPLRALAVLTLALLTARIAIALADPFVMDVGYASVAGAQRILDGQTLYTAGGSHFDTYGPVAYLGYIPFVLVWPFHESQANPPAAQAAAIAFDLLTVGGLLALGRRLAPRTSLGWALALAWVACPFTALTLAVASHDALVSAALVWTLVAFARPPGRGALLGVAAAAKFAPGLLAPLFASGDRDRDLRAATVFAVAFVVVVVATLLPLLPPGGLREFYDATIGFQLHRFSPFSLWTEHPGLDWLQTALQAAALALALLVAVVPHGRRTLGQVAALGAAVLVAAQLPLTHWFYFYVVWFLPLVCVALLGEHTRAEPRATGQLARG